MYISSNGEKKILSGNMGAAAGSYALKESPLFLFHPLSHFVKLIPDTRHWVCHRAKKLIILHRYLRTLPKN